MEDDWCAENDGAYRAEVAAMHRDSLESRNARLSAENDALRARVARLEEERRYLVAAASYAEWARVDYGDSHMDPEIFVGAFNAASSGAGSMPDTLAQADACLAALDAEAGQ